MRGVKVHVISPPPPSLSAHHSWVSGNSHCFTTTDASSAPRGKQARSPSPCARLVRPGGWESLPDSQLWGYAADWTQWELPSEHSCIRMISLTKSLCQATFPVAAQRFCMYQGYSFCQSIQELKIGKPGYLRDILCILNLSPVVVLSSTFWFKCLGSVCFS